MVRVSTSTMAPPDFGLDVRRPAEILHEDDLTRRRLPNARAALLSRELEIVSVKADGV